MESLPLHNLFASPYGFGAGIIGYILFGVVLHHVVRIVEDRRALPQARRTGATDARADPQRDRRLLTSSEQLQSS